jgi:hypothetical protein
MNAAQAEEKCDPTNFYKSSSIRCCFTQNMKRKFEKKIVLKKVFLSLLNNFNWLFGGQDKSTYTFSAERLPLSAPPPPRGKWKSEYVRRKTVTLVYPDPLFGVLSSTFIANLM